MTAAEQTDDDLVVVIARSGGLAGMTREWRAVPAGDDLPHWHELVDRCPWDAAPPPSRGADRFQWRIEVRHGETAVREARLGDTQVEGPWRALIDEVRQAASD